MGSHEIARMPEGLTNSLDPDEQVLWQGKPDMKITYILAAAVFVIVFFAYFHSMLGTLVAHEPQKISNIMLGMCAIATGIYGFAIWSITRTTHKSHYAITDARVLIYCDATRKPKIESYDLDTLTPWCKFNILGKSILCWRAPGTTWSASARANVPNRVTLFWVPQNTNRLVNMQFPSGLAAPPPDVTNG